MPIEKAIRPVMKEPGIGIERTEGVCGGSARIAGTRIPSGSSWRRRTWV